MKSPDKLKTNFLMFILFGVPMGIFFTTQSITQTGDILYSIIIGAISGFISGLLFALIMGMFINVQAKKFRPIREQIAKEHELLYDGGANHLVNKEGVGGWLFLTSNGLFFKSHKFNFQKHELWISYESISSLSTFKSLGFIENGMLIERIDGTQNKFVVQSPKIWTKKIESQR